MTIQLTSQESEEYFYNALCNSLDYMHGYGLAIDYDSKAYSKAREQLTESYCYEDVLLQILKNGGTLTLHDFESGEMTRTITLQDVHERVPKTPLSHLMNMVQEQDDAETGDVLLQTVFYEELIFG